MKVPWWALPGVAAIVFTLASVSATESSLKFEPGLAPPGGPALDGSPHGPPPGERRARNPDPVVDPGPPTRPGSGTVPARRHPVAVLEGDDRHGSAGQHEGVRRRSHDAGLRGPVTAVRRRGRERCVPRPGRGPRALLNAVDRGRPG